MSATLQHLNQENVKRLAPHNAGLAIVSGYEFDVLEPTQKSVCLDSVEDFHLIKNETLKTYLLKKFSVELVEEMLN